MDWVGLPRDLVLTRKARAILITLAANSAVDRFSKIRSFENDGFSQDRLPRLDGQGRHLRMGFLQGGNLPEVVGGAGDEAGQVAVGDSRFIDDNIPVVPTGPVINHRSRPEQQRGDAETRSLHPLGDGLDRGCYAPVSPCQLRGQALPVQGDLLIAVVDKGGDDGGEELFILLGEGVLSQALGDEQGLVQPELRGPDAVVRETVVFVDETLLLQKGHMPEEINPQILGLGLDELRSPAV